MMQPGFKLALAGGLAAGTVVLSGLAITSLMAPDSALARAAPLSGVTEARADAAMLDGRIAEASVETTHTLSLAPGSPSAWLRRAWIADEEGRVLDRNAAVDRSYSVAPYGPDVSAWRLRFVLDRWATMSPDLRESALVELASVQHSRPALVQRLRDNVSDPAGRLALVMATS